MLHKIQTPFIGFGYIALQKEAQHTFIMKKVRENINYVSKICEQYPIFMLKLRLLMIHPFVYSLVRSVFSYLFLICNVLQYGL